MAEPVKVTEADMPSQSGPEKRNYLDENLDAVGPLEHAATVEPVDPVNVNYVERVALVEPKPVDPVGPVEPVDPVEPAATVEPVDPILPLPLDSAATVEPVKPVAPVEPVDPIEPVDPFEPAPTVEPVDYVEPVDPVEFVDPVALVSHVEPVDPVDPVDPAEHPVQPVDPVELIGPEKKMVQDWYKELLEKELQSFFSEEYIEIKDLDIGLEQQKKMEASREFISKNPQPDTNRSQCGRFQRSLPPVEMAAAEMIKVKLVKGQYKNRLLPFKIPDEAYLKPTKCTLLGFDNCGNAFVRFHDDKIEGQHRELMSMMKEVYNHTHPRLISVYSARLYGGDLVIAKIPVGDASYADENKEENHTYVRGRIVEVNNKSKIMTLVDIDDQSLHEVPVSKLYWTFEHFLNSPRMSIKCNLRYLESYKGDKVILEASYLCPAPPKMFGMIVKDPYAQGDTSIPTLELYKNYQEAIGREWSYNSDLLQAMVLCNNTNLFKKALIRDWYQEQLEKELRFFFSNEHMEMKDLEVGFEQRKKMKVLREFFSKNPLQDIDRSQWGCFQRSLPPVEMAAAERIKVKLVKGQYKNRLLPFKIPDEAYLKPTKCTLLGFDSCGSAFVRFHDDSIEEQHLGLMSMINEVYNHAHPRLISVYNSARLCEGDLVIAKIPVGDEFYNDEIKEIYIRGRILEVNHKSKSITLVDIDDQLLHEVPVSKLYWIFEHFLNSPMMSIKCNLRYLETYKGDTSIPEASCLCTASSKMFGMIVKDPYAQGDTSIPTLELYKNYREAIGREWSYNFDLLQALML